ncbi:MAG: YkgJ family cysteine cluster protein [Nitrososphaerales archaeon]
MKNNVCTNHRCVSCCYGTEMLLLEEDVKRIVGLGYKEQFFAAGSEGFKVLKNSSAGRCVFHDGKQCTIYENRPKGCKLYPVIFDEDSMSAVKDELCPYRDEFRLSPRARRELSDVYPKLLSERLDRIRQAQNRSH